MSFAALEQRANAAVMRRLSNARAKPVGEFTDFPVIFDIASLQTPAGVSAAQPLATALDSDVASFRINADGAQLEIKEVTYTVQDLQPDGTGFTVIVLEVA